jgi:hypothetical protein
MPYIITFLPMCAVAAAMSSAPLAMSKLIGRDLSERP